MAWEWVTCNDCGNEYRVQMYGSRSQKEWKIDNWWGICDDCKKRGRDEENQKSANRNKEMGLPELMGTEKQIAWAETLRCRFIKKVMDAADSEYLKAWIENESVDRPDQRIEAAVENLKSNSEASFWIEFRYVDNYQSFLKEMIEETELPDEIAEREKFQTVEKEIIDAALAESTVRPEKPETETVAEISYLNKDKHVELIIRFPEKRDDFRKTVKKRLSYTWDSDKTAWHRIIDKFAGLPEHRIAEAGHVLLSKGFCIRTFDQEIREMAVSGGFEKEVTRWIQAITQGKYKGYFCIKWAKHEDYYKNAKRIAGAKYSRPNVVVPPENYEEVIDFSKLHKFTLSEGAEELIEKAAEIKAASYVANIVVEEEQIDMGKERPLLIPKEVEIDAEFLDEEI